MPPIVDAALTVLGALVLLYGAVEAVLDRPLNPERSTRRDTTARQDDTRG